MNKHEEMANAGNNPVYGLDDSDATIDVRNFPNNRLGHDFQNPLYCKHKRDSNCAQDKQRLDGNQTTSDAQNLEHKLDGNPIYDSPDSVPKSTSQYQHTTSTTYDLLSESTPHDKENTHLAVGVKSQDDVQAISDREYAVPEHLNKAANFVTSVDFDNPAYSSPFGKRAGSASQQLGAGGQGSNNNGISPAVSVDVNYSQPIPPTQHIIPKQDHKMANSYDLLSSSARRPTTGAREKQTKFDDPVYADEAVVAPPAAVAVAAAVRHGSTVHQLPPPVVGFDDPEYGMPLATGGNDMK